MPHSISAIVLAAGESKRFGRENKLLTDWSGKAMIRHVVETVLAAELAEVVVVAGYEADSVAAALDGLNVRCVRNDGYLEGMGASIGCGVRQASEGMDGFLIVLGDMPHVRTETIRALAKRLNEGAIVVPFAEDRQGNPVLFAAEYRMELESLTGDKGARPILERHAGRIDRIQVAADELEDVDSASPAR